MVSRQTPRVLLLAVPALALFFYRSDSSSSSPGQAGIPFQHVVVDSAYGVSRVKGGDCRAIADIKR